MLGASRRTAAAVALLRRVGGGGARTPSVVAASAPRLGAPRDLRPQQPARGFQTGGLSRGQPRYSTDVPADLAGINSKVLDDVQLAAAIGPALFSRFHAARTSSSLGPDRVTLTKQEKNDIAKAVREWAMSRGISTYAHWFSPVRGPVHGEKIETFIALNFATNELDIGLSGTELFQSETDGSSFPNGGLRTTHAAAAYMAWDLSSPPFIYDDVLYIPSVFVSWTGEALDYKTPLLRANDALDREATKFLKHLGDKDVTRVVTNVGIEQEFFALDRDVYLQRPDLVACGRTLLGQTPLKGQEASKNYFAQMPLRVREFMQDAKAQLWELGVSIVCMHNEVAPGQHELSPIFSLTQQASDMNVVLMDLLAELGQKHGLYINFHEKPFAGINGTGKHNNWGMNTDTGANLFVPGKSDAENRRFVAMCAALVRAVDLHGDLLRAGVSTAGNDHRLGAQEAPPAIITLYLGEHLEKFIKEAGNGGPLHGYGAEDKALIAGSPVEPIVAAHEDRNRTAPFPWCGNRFEYRAVGGDAQCAWPLTLVNAAMAESLAHMNAEIESGKDADTVIRETIKKHEGAFFHGDGYDAPLIEKHAQDHNLFHLKTTPDALDAFESDKNKKLFSQLGIFTEHEVTARADINREEFATTIQIEARTMLRMLRNDVLPAVYEDIERETRAGLTKNVALEAKRELATKLIDATEALHATYDAADHESPAEAARFADESIRPAMAAARAIADELEGRISSWPYPTTMEMVRNHH